VIRQTYGDFECLCVDDGSSDGSGTILDLVASQNARIKVFHVKNGGVCLARNLALEHANGEWLLFLDGDDVLHTRALEVLARLLEENYGADMALVGRKEFSTLTFDEPMIAAPVVSEMRDVTECIDAEVYYRVFWQGCYRRSVYGDMRMDASIRCNMGEDIVYYCEALERARKILDIHAPLYGYRQRAGSAMHTRKSVEKWHYDLKHYERCFYMINASQKRFDRKILKEIGTRLTEGVALPLREMGKGERKNFWNDLIRVYGIMRGMRIFPIWLRFVTYVLYSTKSYSMYRVFAELPYRIKRMGIHR